jgi:flagellar hook-basal body complex protein FliE
MAILPISPLGMSNLSGLTGVGQARAAAPAASEAGGGSFSDSIVKALDQVAASHDEADRLAVQAATGDLNAVHDFTIAATEAQLMTQLTVEVRNRAIEAFNDIMHMQV